MPAAPGASILDLRSIQVGYHYSTFAQTYNLMYVPNRVDNLKRVKKVLHSMFDHIIPSYGNARSLSISWPDQPRVRSRPLFTYAGPTI